MSPEKISGLVEVLNIQAGDKLVLYVEVGRAPYNPTTKMLEHVKRLAAEVFPDNKVFVSAMRDGKPDIRFAVLRSED